MGKLIITTAVAGVLAAGGIAGTVAAAAPANADFYPCGSTIIAGNGGGRCDSAPASDGSFTRCDTVYVLGFGGTSCYQVNPPAP